MKKLLLTVLLFAPCLSNKAAASFGSVVGMWTNDLSTAAWTFTITNNVPIGQRLIGFFGWEASSATNTITITDSLGNQYTEHNHRLNNSVHNIATFSGLITNSIVSGVTTMTITLSAAESSARGVTLFTGLGLAQTGQPDVKLVTNHFNTNIFDVLTPTKAGSFIVSHVQAQQIASGGGATQILYTNTGSTFILLPGITNMSFGYNPGSTVGLRHYMAYKVAGAAGTNAMGGYYSESLPTPHDESWLLSMVAFNPANTYYIDFATGSDAALGTDTTIPWKHCPGDTNATGVAASTTPTAGDTFIFKGGVTYTGDIAIKQSGTSGAPITYDGTGSTWGSGVAIVDLTATYYHAFYSNPGKDWITLNGFDIKNAKNQRNTVGAIIDRGGVTVTNTYTGDGDIYSEGVIFDLGGDNWNLLNISIHDCENAYDRSVLGAEGSGDPAKIFTVPCLKAGIELYGGANNCTISNYNAWAVGEAALKFFGATNFFVLNSNIGGTNSSMTNAGWFAVALKLSGVSGFGAQGVVSNLVCHEGWQYQGDESQQRCHAGDWFHFFGDNDGVLNPTNDVHDVDLIKIKCYNDKTFQYFNGTAYSLFESDWYNIRWINCLFLNGFSGDLEFRDGDNLGFLNCSFIDLTNTVCLNPKSGASTIPYNATNIYGTNNIFLTFAPNSANTPCGTSGGYTNTVFPKFDYNVYYSPNNGNNVWRWNGTNYSFAAWKTLTGKDANSFYSNPLLVSIPPNGSTTSSGDYHPTTNSVAYLAGANLSGVTTVDYENTTRTIPWTISALLSSGGGTPSITNIFSTIMSGTVILRGGIIIR
jgi:hypothetical protein